MPSSRARSVMCTVTAVSRRPVVDLGEVVIAAVDEQHIAWTYDGAARRRSNASALEPGEPEDDNTLVAPALMRVPTTLRRTGWSP